MAEEVKNNDGEEVEEGKTHGNTGLPFGLCAKYGIVLPRNATPREAWNALKHRGIYPPWTEKGKDQYTSDKNDKTKEYVDEKRKQVYDRLRAVMDNKVPTKYREAVEKQLEMMDENELDIFDKTLHGVNYSFTNRTGGASYSPFWKTITISDEPTALDKELGLDAEMTTFFHEYGHYLEDRVFGRDGIRRNPEVRGAINEDLSELCNKICNDKGLGAFNKERIKREQSDAIYQWLTDESGVSETNRLINVEMDDFVREQPWRYQYEDESEYIKADAEYRRYVDSGERAADYKRWLNAIGEGQRKALPYRIQNQRFGFLSDTLSPWTNGRINGRSQGLWGHTVAYDKETLAGAETWAEYCSFRGTKDTKGLDMFEKYMPRTKKVFDNLYDNMAKEIKE